MALFCASLCWRILRLAFEATERRFLADHREALSHSALATWREFLDHKVGDPGPFQLHLVPRSAFSALPGELLHPFFNRYLTLGVAADLLEDDSSLMVYANIRNIVILGMIESDSRDSWSSMRVKVAGGSVARETQRVPDVLVAFMNHGSEVLAQAARELNPGQQDAIAKLLTADPDLASKSHYLLALREDIKNSNLGSALPGLTEEEGLDSH